MTEERKGIFFPIIAILFFLAGIAVFAIRLQHPGDYAMPQGAAPIGAVALFLMGGLLLWRGKPRFLGWIILLVSPVALFPVIYSIMGESEEVISLYANDQNGNPVDLRLWIVDREDGAWVGMPRAKAIDHALDGAQLEMLRAGERVCVMPVLYDEDRQTVKTIHSMKVDKYSVAQIAGAIGMYPLEATENTVVLRLDSCE